MKSVAVRVVDKRGVPLAVSETNDLIVRNASRESVDAEPARVVVTATSIISDDLDMC